MQSNEPLIEIRDLTVDYWQQGAWTAVVEQLRLQVASAETFGLVGESGCGKSTTANALLGYRPRSARYRAGSVWFGGRDLLTLPNRELQRLRGRKISLVPQNPTTALSPAMRVGNQIVETLMVHSYCSSGKEAKERTLELFRLVSLPAPEKIFAKYPHQLSGGQQQRIIIGMALACEPQLIVLDEPTTGLDVTTQAQILDLLADLRTRYGLAMFYVTHNLGVVAQICHRIGVMYAGRLLEVAPKHELFQEPLNPYTQGLIASVPRIGTPSRRQSSLLKGILRRSELPAGCPFAPRCDFVQAQCIEEMPPLADMSPSHSVACWRWQEVPPFAERLSSSQGNVEQPDARGQQKRQTLLKVQDLQAGYVERRGALSLRRYPKIVVDDIFLEIKSGETFALVGESGSGKTTVARALNGLVPYVSGRSEFEGSRDLTISVDKRSRAVLRCIQLVFQNPDASLNPRHRVGQIISRPLELFFGLSGTALSQRVESLLADVHLDVSFCDRFPDELSGGERQRVAIARALAAEPKLLLCDEILSALDVSVQANILELLIDVQARRGIAFLFISHDLAVVRSLANRVGVMYWGSLCEVGDVEEVFRPPYHPYTYLLLSAVPEADPDQVIPAVRRDIGLVSDDSKTACPFAPRCPMRARRTCQDAAPPWQQVSATHSLRCHASLKELDELDLWAERFRKQ